MDDTPTEPLGFVPMPVVERAPPTNPAPQHHKMKPGELLHIGGIPYRYAGGGFLQGGTPIAYARELRDAPYVNNPAVQAPAERDYSRAVAAVAPGPVAQVAALSPALARDLCEAVQRGVSGPVLTLDPDAFLKAQGYETAPPPASTEAGEPTP